MKNETQKHEQKILKEKLPTGYPDKYEELTTGPHARRRTALKRLAKKLSKEYEIKITHAHEIIARMLGFKTYNAFLASTK